MRIAFDARMMGADKTRGIGRYIEELIQAMVSVAPEHRFVLLVRDPKKSPFRDHPSVEHVTADVPWYGLAEQFRLPKLLAQAKPDIVHIPHWNVPIFSRLPRVVTIHDLVLLDEPKSAKVSTRGFMVSGIKRLGYHVALRSALFGSRRILVPTNWVASRIKQHFPSLKTPIEVTGEGMPELNQEMWEGSDRAHPYLLAVGSAYPHKNLDLLLDAWKELVDRHSTLSLVFVGERDVFMRQLEERVRQEKLPRVRFAGVVSDAALATLYAKASALVFPSRNEGFGLPPLEALAHGCPVIAAKVSSLPEVLGPEGAIFFQPQATNDILRAIETALYDPVGVRDRARHAASLLRERHDWRRAAERTLEAYDKALRT